MKMSKNKIIMVAIIALVVIALAVTMVVLLNKDNNDLPAGTDKLIISAESVTVNKGTGEVTVNIRVYNNPGIMGAVLKVSVNDQMFSFKSASKAGFPGLTLTSPGPSTTSSPYTFMLDALELSGEDRKDGTLFSITFKIDNPNATGTYDVKLSYNNNGIFDENYNYPNVVLEDGTITIK